MPMPTRFGHEFCGDVIAVGEGVEGFSIGDAVMSVHSAPCMRCAWCRRGQHELCERVMETKILGAYAQSIEVPAHIVACNVYQKPDGIDYATGAFLEPLSCVVHSVRFLDPRPAETVAVIGDGGFGLLHAAVLMQRGVRAIVVGRHPDRLAIAAAYGAVATLDIEDARGADAVIECTGRADVWEAVPAYVRRGGTVSFFGGLPADARVSFLAARLHYDEIRLCSPFHFTPAAVREAYDLLANRVVDPRPLVSDTVSLAEIASAFERLDAGNGIKYAVIP